MCYVVFSQHDVRIVAKLTVQYVTKHKKYIAHILSKGVVTLVKFG